MDFSRAHSVRPSFSVEFFPPKDQAGEQRLWDCLGELTEIAPDFVSVTYGAGGSTRERTIRITREITDRTKLATVAHLTCVGSNKDQLIEILEQYKAAGISRILALRGDPQGGPRSEWITSEGGFDHADQLVVLAKERGFSVGVAAFPDGHPASAGNMAQDLDVLVRKFELGAEFATTQFFFDVKKYQELLSNMRERGSHAPIIAGILPITNVKQLLRMSELSGTQIPAEIRDRILKYEDDPISVRRVGVEIALEISDAILASGAPGLHFYTMNSSQSTLEIVDSLGLRKKGEAPPSRRHQEKE
jgi:methylenetetrahydrofolate reductase (NADPH)